MSKCKYVKTCKMFSEDSVTCMETKGMYYGDDRPAGCYRFMAKMEENTKK